MDDCIVAEVQFSPVLHLFLRTENWTDNLQEELRTEQDWTGKNHSSLSSKGALEIECQTYTWLVSPAEGPKKKKWRSQQLKPKITVEPHIDLS